MQKIYKELPRIKIPQKQQTCFLKINKVNKYAYFKNANFNQAHR